MEFFVDLHVHVGRTSKGDAVKMAASSDLTLESILRESMYRKGLDGVGVVDCASPGVQEDVRRLLDAGDLASLPGGGLVYHNRLTLFPAAEIGADVNGREAHFISYFPSLEDAARFTALVAPYVTNIRLSSQKARLSATGLLEITAACGGFLVPAHVFTPHKGYYGHAAARLEEGFGKERGRIFAVELGLSADTEMASRLSDLDGLAFLTNSDAHSTAKIAREYNKIEAQDLSFESLAAALKGEGGKIAANYGLDPRLGKYHRTRCDRCGRQIPLLPERVCPECGSNRITVGVRDRLDEVADRDHGDVSGRPPYIHQVPLEFIPGVGRRTLERLLDAFGAEMNVLHRAAADELCAVVGEKVAASIVLAREGRLKISAGGGGIYGRVEA